MPFDDLTGASGFTSDSDGANANLDITMSEDSARNLWDVQAAVQQIAADFQTAVRAASDFNSYLISIRETGQTIKLPELGMGGGEGGNMTYSGGRVDSSSVPMISQSEASMAQRVGEMEENSSGAGSGAMAAMSSARAGGRPTDVGGIVSQATNLAWMGGMMGGQQHGAGGRSEVGSAYEQAYQFALQNEAHPDVVGASYGGQVGTPRAFAAQQILNQGIPAATQFLRGGGAGGFASMLGKLGTVGAIGYSVYQLGNAAAETYAQSRAMAISANNPGQGVGWGFQQRAGQAFMSLSPYVTSEEASQIYSSAISQGWASRQGGLAEGNFGQAINFMYGAAKNYNMSPEMSAQLLQTNSMGVHQSIQTLNEQLGTLKETMEGTGVSLEAVNSGFTSFTGQLISAGATGATAAQVAGGAAYGFGSNEYLKNGRGLEILQGTLGSQQTQNILSGLLGVLPGAALAGPHTQQSIAAMDQLTQQMVNDAQSQYPGDPTQAAAQFALMYNASFNPATPMTEQDAENYIAMYSTNPGALTQGQAEYKEKAKIRSTFDGDPKLQARGWKDKFVGQYRDDLTTGSIGHRIGMGAADVLGAVPMGIYHGIKAFFGGDTENTVTNYSPEVNTLLDSSADASKVQVLDDKGNVVATGRNDVSKWFSNKDNYQKFAADNSKYTIKDPSSNQTWNAKNIGTASESEMASASNTANTVTITLSPQAKQWFDTNKKDLKLSDGKNTSGG